MLQSIYKILNKYLLFYDIYFTFFVYNNYRSEPETFNQPKGHKTMTITDIKIRKLFEDGPMKAVVSVTFDAALAVHDIKVIYARDRFFIVMPSRKNPDGTFRDIVHPINVEFRTALEEAVISAYHAEVEAYENGTSPLCKKEEAFEEVVL